jgi:hypothetical protein
MPGEEQPVKRSAAVLVVIVWEVCLAACTPLPKSFTPHTAEEQAVVYTIRTFLTAWHARDLAALHMLVTPAATMDAFVDGSPVPPERILAVRQPADYAPLLGATADHLVDFRQPSPQSAAVETYVYNYVRDGDLGIDQETTRIRWDLVRRNGQWQIDHIAQTTWLHPFYIRGIGPS